MTDAICHSILMPPPSAALRAVGPYLAAGAAPLAIRASAARLALLRLLKSHRKGRTQEKAWPKPGALASTR
jgi:hypothetical protein